MTVASLSGIDVEAIEYKAHEGSAIAGKALKDVRFPKAGVIGTIIRGDQIILPKGVDVVLPGDEVIVFAMPSAIPDIEKLFA
jgi:trk system potassium uptake protein TrkA